MAEFRLLGAVELWSAGQRLELGPRKQQATLAALVLDANRVVTVATLIDRIWAESAPGSARGSVHAYISRLRRIFATALSSDADRVDLVHQAGGYRLEMDPCLADVHRFGALVANGLDVSTNESQRAGSLREALALWQGEPLPNLTGDWADQIRDGLRQQRLAAALALAGIELSAGRPAGLIDLLRGLQAEQPLVEPVGAMLMRALYQENRAAEALDCYARIRRRLSEELGTEPGNELRQVHSAILRGDTELRLAEVSIVVNAAPKALPSRPTPAQLPPAVAPFVGRRSELNRLDGYTDQAGALRVVTVTGTAGIGKTALAVNWAHHVAHRFPDGQLFVDLRGFDAGQAALDPADAVRGFLDALGVAPDRIPADLADRTSLYRSLLAGRRMLVVLDNAADADQVRPLLPGAAGCVVVITSRHRLAGLVAAEGARPMALDLLSETESRQLLAERVGAQAVAASPDAVSAIIHACARLPLALAIAAARAATYPELGLGGLAAQLTDIGGRLDALSVADSAVDLRTVLLGSYRALPLPAARTFRLLSLHPGVDIGLSSAASLAGESIDQACAQLTALTDSHLLARTGDRYSFHDVLRAFAVERTHAEDSPQVRRAAEHRLFDHFLRTAFAAARLRQPRRAVVELPPAVDGVSCAEFVAAEQATAWFAAERVAVVAAVERAAANGFRPYVRGLAWAVSDFLDTHEYWSDSRAVNRSLLRSARSAGDQEGQVLALVELATMAIRLGQHGEAVELAGEAVELDTDAAVAARARLLLAWALDKHDRPEEALDQALGALATYRSLGEASGQAHALNGAGWCYGRLHDHRQMLSHCVQALRMYRTLGNARGEAAALDSVGRAHHHLGRHAEAVRHYRLALDIDVRLRDRYNEAETLCHLAETFQASGRPAEARSAWVRALELLHAVNHPSAEDVAARLRGLRESSLPAMAHQPSAPTGTAPSSRSM